MKKVKIYYFCLTILSLAPSFCFIHDFLLKKTALGKREFLKVGLRLINIQAASLLSLKFVAAIFHPTDLISQAELESLDVVWNANMTLCDTGTQWQWWRTEPSDLCSKAQHAQPVNHP